MTDDGRGEWKPKPIVFPKKEPKAEDNWAPRPISFPPKNPLPPKEERAPKPVSFGPKTPPKAADDWAPKPVSFGPKKEAVVTDPNKPRPITFGAPKNLPPAKDGAPKNDAPKAATFAPRPAPPPQAPQVPLPGPKAASFAPRPAPSPVAPEPAGPPRAATFQPTASTSEQVLEQKTGRNIVTPEEAKFNLMVAKAAAYDPVVGARPGFVKRLQALAAMAPREVLNWGGKSLDTNKAVTDKLAAIARDLTFQDVARWVDEAQTESTKPPVKPGLFDRLKGVKSQTPEFYEHKLAQIRDTLDQIITPKLEQAVREISEVPDVFAMEVLALKVWSEGLTDATAMQIADNRHRILIQAEQGILMTKQALENMQVSVAASIQQIDELLLTVLPKWKIAYAHQVKP